MLQLRWMYQSPGLSPDLDLVVSQPVQTHIRSPFSQRLHQNPAFGGRGLRRTRPFFSSASNSALLKSRFDQPGSAVMAMARMASPSRAAATRMNATASSV